MSKNFNNHVSRIVLLFIFLCIFVGVVTSLVGLFYQWFFNYAVRDGLFFEFLTFSLLFCWASNVRFGWIENILLESREYPFFKVWCEVF